MQADLRRPRPLGEDSTEPYGTVVSAYCADSATDDLTTWQTYMRRIAGMVRPGGTLLIAALRRSHGYRVGGKLFPSANVDEADLQLVLQPLFKAELKIEVGELPDASPKGYSSIVLVEARDRCTARPTGKL